MATKLTRQIVDEILPYLIHLAETRQVTTYRDLAERTGRHPRNFNHPLGYIRDEICMSRALPLLTALVVNQSTGMPGEGFLPHGRQMLTDHEYELEYIRFRDEVFAFKDWQSILGEYGLDPVAITDEDIEGLAATHREVRERQETSEEERVARAALKRFAADNPKALFIPSDDPPTWNYDFGSGELCDLLFEVAWPQGVHLVSVCYGHPGELVHAIEQLQSARERLLAERGAALSDRITLRLVSFAIPETIGQFAKARGVKTTVISRTRVLGDA